MSTKNLFKKLFHVKQKKSIERENDWLREKLHRNDRKGGKMLKYWWDKSLYIICYKYTHRHIELYIHDINFLIVIAEVTWKNRWILKHWTAMNCATFSPFSRFLLFCSWIIYTKKNSTCLYFSFDSLLFNLYFFLFHLYLLNFALPKKNFFFWTKKIDVNNFLCWSSSERMKK